MWTHGTQQLTPTSHNVLTKNISRLPWDRGLEVQLVILNCPLPWLKFLQEALCTLYCALGKGRGMEREAVNRLTPHIRSEPQVTTVQTN